MLEIIGTLKGEAITKVDSTNTAITAGSGSLSVFGTPFMLALMEKATCVACEPILEKDETTVGINVNISHDKASGMGAVIRAYAQLTNIDGRKLTFDVVAKDNAGAVIGKGEITRFVVNSNKFMKKVEAL